MLPRLLFHILKWPVVLALLGGLLWLAYTVHERMQKRAREESEAVPATRRLDVNVIKLGKELAESHGIESEAAEAVTWYERLPVYGRVVPNPRATFEVRSAFAGTLRAGPDNAWPVPGKRVQAGQLLGRVDVRFGPQEQLDLQGRLNDALHKREGAEEILQIQQERVDRLKKLSNPEAFGRRELDEALVQLADARTQFTTAKASVALWQNALDELKQRSNASSSTWSRPLTAPAAGEVVELAGQPGTAVEAGGLVLRVVDFRRVLVRLDLPPELLAAEPPNDVELTAITPAPPGLRGATNRTEPAAAPPTVKATLAGPAPQVDVVSQFAGYWYEIASETKSDGVPWRPGLFVKALVKSPQARPQDAVAVPASTLLYHQGRALVYVCVTDSAGKIEPGKFARREVRILGREGDRFILAARQELWDPPEVGIKPGESVVVSNAQVLLSEEFRSDVDND